MTLTSAPAPYRYVADERKAALFDKGRRPQGLAALLAWAREEWEAEVPGRLHVAGVEQESALGTPKTAPEMRAYIERDDRSTDAEPSDPDDPHAAYAKPMHAALHRMHRSHARFLLVLALNAFDWAALCERMKIPAYVARVYTEWALGLWWECYERAPLRT